MRHPLLTLLALAQLLSPIIISAQETSRPFEVSQELSLSGEESSAMLSSILVQLTYVFANPSALDAALSPSGIGMGGLRTNARAALARALQSNVTLLSNGQSNITVSVILEAEYDSAVISNGAMQTRVDAFITNPSQFFPAGFNTSLNLLDILVVQLNLGNSPLPPWPLPVAPVYPPPSTLPGPPAFPPSTPAPPPPAPSFPSPPPSTVPPPLAPTPSLPPPSSPSPVVLMPSSPPSPPRPDPPQPPLSPSPSPSPPLPSPSPLAPPPGTPSLLPTSPSPPPPSPSPLSPPGLPPLPPSPTPAPATPSPPSLRAPSLPPPALSSPPTPPIPAPAPGDSIQMSPPSSPNPINPVNPTSSSSSGSGAPSAGIIAAIVVPVVAVIAAAALVAMWLKKRNKYMMAESMFGGHSHLGSGAHGYAPVGGPAVSVHSPATLDRV